MHPMRQTAPVRLTDFWERMEEVFGPAYAHSWANDVVLPPLGLTVEQAIASGIAPEALDEQRFGELLYTGRQPDPDLLIRTSGEMRVSNFLLWQIAYAEIWVTDTLWPDFRCRHLLEAILAYQKRDRRYGGLTSAPVALSAK